jgi:hypothetical protein
MSRPVNPLPCRTVVYRAILKKSYINRDTSQWRQILPNVFLGALLPRAFMPKHNEGGSTEQGISLHIAERSPERYSEECGLTNFGAASLHVGYMRDIALNVVYDEDQTPATCPAESPLRHCSVEGIPEWTSDEAEALERAETIADQLSQQAYLQYDKTNTYQKAQSDSSR